jgi:adenine deaminase
MSGLTIIRGILADWQERRFVPSELRIRGGRIKDILPLAGTGDFNDLPYLLPGFVDAHVHIESSMVIPSEFARLAVVHGTVATVSDPHEIANVCGVAGVDMMIRDGARTPFKFNFGAPSCVPATIFETAGDALDSVAVARLLDRPEIRYLSEMMNFPGALHGDPEVMAKIEAAHLRGKPVDGHAPGLRGEDARRYIDRGISTDHECFTAEEALDKLRYGMKILIREGSAARNFEALIGLVPDHADRMMFCSDDKHPDSLVDGHINLLCARAAAKGVPPFDIIRVACVNPVLHYTLDVGLLRKGDPADLILVKNLQDFEVLETWIDGEKVAEEGRSLIQADPPKPGTPAPQTVNRFNCRHKDPDDLAMAAGADAPVDIPVIQALDGQLITHNMLLPVPIEQGQRITDPVNDILKLVVVNRYQDAPVAKAFITGFGMKQGALASTVAHDSHNIVAVGVDDESLCRAINLVIDSHGGVSCVNEEEVMVLPLPVGGLMSADDGYRVAEIYTLIDAMAKRNGSTLSAPFMTLSFMALLVIPDLKLSDKGLFDGKSFSFIPGFEP